METAIAPFVEYLKAHDLSYVALIILLFIVPQILKRIGVPLAMGAFVMGVFSSGILNIFANDSVIPIFSLLGISSLFLYAGLEVNFSEITNNGKILLQHVVARVITILITVGVSVYFLELSYVVASLLALALLTPSTGFILDSLHVLKISEDQKMWVKMLAISSEITALFLLVLIQAKTPAIMGISIITILLLAVVLPLLFKWVSQYITIKTPGADFSFLLLLAVATGTLTKKMGAYYLVGAFLVGFTVNFYEKNIAKTSNEHLESAAKFFAAFFMPFYFFNTGLKLDPSVFSLEALWMSLIFIGLALPIRIGSIVAHRKLVGIEALKQSFPIAITLLPTLVFGLVMVEMLKVTGEVSSSFIGGVVIYTLVMTMFPTFIFMIIRKLRN